MPEIRENCQILLSAIRMSVLKRPQKKNGKLSLVEEEQAGAIPKQCNTLNSGLQVGFLF